jgi:hypothetical protein
MYAIALSLTAASMLAATMSADARERLRKNEAWCLETSNGPSGGGTRFECTFESRAQCLESKVSHADHCMRNPRG